MMVHGLAMLAVPPSPNSSSCTNGHYVITQHPFQHPGTVNPRVARVAVYDNSTIFGCGGHQLLVAEHRGERHKGIPNPAKREGDRREVNP